MLLLLIPNNFSEHVEEMNLSRACTNTLNKLIKNQSDNHKHRNLSRSGHAGRMFLSSAVLYSKTLDLLLILNLLKISFFFLSIAKVVLFVCCHSYFICIYKSFIYYSKSPAHILKSFNFEQTDQQTWDCRSTQLWIDQPRSEK